MIENLYRHKNIWNYLADISSKYLFKRLMRTKRGGPKRDGASVLTITSVSLLTLLAPCQVARCWHNWLHSPCSPHTPCTPCIVPTSTCAFLAGTSWTSPLSHPALLLNLHPWLWPCSQHQNLLKRREIQLDFIHQGCRAKTAYSFSTYAIDHLCSLERI